MASINDLERRIVQLERSNRALERDLQAARGIGVGKVKARAKMDAGGMQIEHVAAPGKNADVAQKIDTEMSFPTTPSPLSGHEEAFLMAVLV
jgi:hypothetical protein